MNDKFILYDMLNTEKNMKINTAKFSIIVSKENSPPANFPIK